MDRISIVVPVYNVEKYISKCIESIIEQTYTNLEIILVDDGSTDISGKICDEYAIQDDRIKVIHKKNGGISDARNAGIIISNGKYIAFVDSDDYIDRCFIEKLYNACIDFNCDISICEFTRVKGNNALVENDYETYTAQLYDKKQECKKMNSVVSIVVWNKLYRKDLFDDIKFPVGRGNEDLATSYKLMYKANKVIIINSKLYYYRMRENSITRMEYSIHNLDELLAIEERNEFYLENKDEDLYKSSLGAYLERLASHYYCAKKYLIENNLELELIQKIKVTYYQLLKLSNHRFEVEIKYSIIRYFPIYYVIYTLIIKKIHTLHRRTI